MLFLIITIGTFIFSISAQEKSSSDLKDKPRPELEEKAKGIIEEVLLELPQLESKENQLIISIMVIELIWLKDERQARQMAQETAEKLRAEFSPTVENQEAVRYAMIYPPRRFTDLRVDFLLMVVKYDAKFALELAALTAPPVLKLMPKSESEQTTIFNAKKDERALEQRMAFLVAEKNSDEALIIARQSLKKGTSDEALNVLRRLHLRDAKSADAWADEIIQKLLTEDFSKDRESYKMTAYFLQQIDEKQGVFGMPRSCNCPAKPLVLNPQKLRKLAAKWLDYAVTLNDEKVSNDFLQMIPVLEKLLPEKKSVIQTKIAAIKKNAPKQVERAQIEEKIFDKETPPEAIAKMGLNKKGNERFYFYNKAFSKAANHSKAALQKLLDSLAEHPESTEKSWLLDEIAANMAGKTAEDGNLDLALEMSQKVTRRDRRVGLLNFLAFEFLKKGEPERAKQVTDEIAALYDLTTKDKLPKAIVGYDIFSGLFRVFALIDTPRAFDLIEMVLPAADENLTRSFPNSNVDEKLDLRNLLNRNAYALTGYTKPIVKLAETDFERTKRLAVYFRTPELSLLAKVLIAQAILKGKLGLKDFSERNEMIILNGG